MGFVTIQDSRDIRPRNTELKSNFLVAKVWMFLIVSPYSIVTFCFAERIIFWHIYLAPTLRHYSCFHLLSLITSKMKYRSRQNVARGIKRTGSWAPASIRLNPTKRNTARKKLSLPFLISYYLLVYSTLIINYVKRFVNYFCKNIENNFILVSGQINIKGKVSE